MTSSPQPLLEVEKLTLDLSGRRILDDISLAVAPGEFLGVIGPNGGGKTSLLRVLLGVLQPSAGRVRWAHASDGGRPHIGYVPQRGGLDRSYPLSTREIVKQGRSGARPFFGAARREVAALTDELLHRVGVAEHAETPFVHLSGGQQRRCLLAVNPLECWLLAGLGLVAVLLCFGCWRWLAQWTFDEELALASGVPTAALRYALILLIAATVILSTRVVGVLLVTAMLILPGAIGTLLGRSMSIITLLSLGVALASTLTGLTISNAADVPPGPAIVLTAFGLFVAAYLLRRHRDQRHSHSRLNHSHEHTT